MRPRSPEQAGRRQAAVTPKRPVPIPFVLAWADRPEFSPEVIRRLPFVMLLCAAALPRARGAALDLTANRIENAGEQLRFTGRAELRQPDLFLTSDEILYDRDTDTATALGHVVLTRGTLRLLAERIVLHRRQGTFSAQHVRVGAYPYYVEGRSASGTRDEVTVLDARIFYGEPGPWQPSATADKVVYTAGTQLRFEGAQVGIGDIHPLPMPRMEQSLSSQSLLSMVSVTGGYRGSLGAYLDSGIHLPTFPGVRLGADVGYYTARGLLVGPAGGYEDPSDPARLHGSFRGGYIDDHGDRKTDVLGQPIPPDRAFFEWQHQQVLADHLTLQGELNWWKDSEVVRDFRPRLFFPVQQPDTDVEATYAGTNNFVSGFARFEPNSFEAVQQRIPEIRYDLLPTPIGLGVLERFDAGVAMLRENPIFAAGAADLADSAATGVVGAPHELRSTRIDAFYGLMRPITHRDWFTLTPVVGGRFTHYMNTTGAVRNGTYTRVLGEAGADAELHASGTFAYANKRWNIDGLRHLFTPRISYRYIPEADKGRDEIPPIDREAFSTYLQPLDLGDMRNIDSLRATNTLRIALDNTIQTRDPKYGSRDLLSFDVAEDFRFKRTPSERTASEIHSDLEANPAPWLAFGFYDTFTPQTFTMTEFNSEVTVHDGTAWSVRFSNNFLRRQLQDYYVDSTAQLNEMYAAITRLRYDQRKHRFDEQAYGIVQNLANTWRISYLVTLYSGPRRESHFGLSVQIDTVRF